MKLGLSKHSHYGDLFEKKLIDVWDVTIKKIVFTGDKSDVGKFLGISRDAVVVYLKRKSVRKKKYALRVAKNKGQ